MRSRGCLLASTVLILLISASFLLFGPESNLLGSDMEQESLTAFSTSVLSAKKMKYWVIDLNYIEGIKLMASSKSFRQSLIDILKAVHFKAYFFEMPGVSREAVAKAPFEFVVVQAPELEKIKPDPQTFQTHFKTDSSVVSFLNLGGDALLVAPTEDAFSGSSHLAKFVREAPNEEVHNFLIEVAEQVVKWANNEERGNKMWLSTCGTGVSWLHMRLDSVPKYYTHLPYITPIELS